MAQARQRTNTRQENPERREFSKQFASIVLTLLSIIQGLAFQALVTKTIAACRAGYGWELLVFFAHALLCLMVVVRVFQTYVTAALYYRRWRADVWDLISIFLIGALEFSLIDALSSLLVHPERFYRVYMTFAGFALIAVCRAYVRVPRLERMTKREKQREQNVQRLNVFMGAALLSSSILVTSWLFFEMPARLTVASVSAVFGSVLILLKMRVALTELFAEKQPEPADIELAAEVTEGMQLAPEAHTQLAAVPSDAEVGCR